MAFLYCTLFPLTCRCQNNEHENDSANGQGFDFERVVYADEFGNDEDMEDNDLPLDLLRLVEQDERQILPHQEVTKAINLRTEGERREVKIGTTLSPDTTMMCLHGHTRTCQVSTPILWYTNCH